MIIPDTREYEVAARAATKATSSPKSKIAFRGPDKSDGAAVWRLINSCPPLDQNSLYCNLLQCTHFADTCIVGERDGEIVGWVSGYRPPAEQSTLFVWQVAVDASARGEGLGTRLLTALLASNGCDGVRRVQTTITQENAASWALFRSLASTLNAPLKHEPWLDRERDFDGRHDTEHLVTIGPFRRG
jgi:L-2,4-diaminobutyric acid acetyltransferase